MEPNALTRLKRVAGKQTTTLTHYGRKTGKPHEVTIWFVVDGDKVTFAPADGPDTDRVQRIARVGSGLLAQSREGWFFAREAVGKVGVAPLADAQTGEVYATHELSGGALLIGAERGLLVAREQGGRVTLEIAGHADTGPAFVLRNLPGGGVLIGAAAGWFVGRIDTGGNITQTPAGPFAIGNVVLEEPDLGLKMRDFGGALLIGSERGLFVASAAGPGCGGR
jgi:ligand-binding sensor domain-containing protein